MKPTEAQVRELWEWCGQKNIIFVDGLCMHDNSKGQRTWLNLDLNNLFQYATDRVKDKIGEKEYFKLLVGWCQKVARGEDHLAKALFWAIYPILK